MNDVFEVVADGLYQSSFRVTVSDRRGKEVYSSNEIGFKWDGSNVGSGVYYWLMNYTTCNYESKKAKGYVQILK